MILKGLFIGRIQRSPTLCRQHHIDEMKRGDDAMAQSSERKEELLTIDVVCLAGWLACCWVIDFTLRTYLSRFQVRSWDYAPCNR